jgi:hypothetical protein
LLIGDLKRVSNIVVLLILLIVFIIPQSSSFNYAPGDEVLDVFKILRILTFPIPILLLLKMHRMQIKNLFLYFIIIFILAINILFFNNLDFGFFYLLSCLFIYDYLDQTSLNYGFIKKIMNIVFLFVVFQFIFYSGKGRVTGSFLDANLAGYFAFILANFYFCTKQRVKASIIILLGIATFSRNFMIAIVLYFSVNFIVNFLGASEFKNKIIERLKVKQGIIFLSLVFIVILSYAYVNFYPENSTISYVKGFDRFSFKNLIDESNYIRFYANVVYFEHLSFNTLLFGFDSSTLLSLQESARYSVLPHNLFISLAIKFGVVILSIYLIYLIRMIKLIGFNNIGYLIGLIMYFNFLGSSSYYGIDLIIQLILLKYIQYYQNTIKANVVINKKT